ncbi:unnamed protein product [Cyclocybe aegerita]|uniref:Indoleamine 2,3-dioxygenase n=1 Tax=Cyclocybe aegerita TaxID=1973307 RepID=A0A8S0Y0Y0_CYCAE|nr:unnamed protein product [Cyclocybe aegerita]
MNITTSTGSIEDRKAPLPVVHVFDVDQRTGFMAPHPPLARLPEAWEIWEAMLDAAVAAKLQLGDKIDLTDEEAAASKEWRKKAREMPLLPVGDLSGSAVLLRRAHLVLAYILHFYVQSLPPDEPVSIPPSISIPILRVSKELDIPPLLTFSDTVLYNWDFRVAPDVDDAVPTTDNIRTQTMFTRTVDEEQFYLCSTRIELRGVEILELMRVTMDETFVGDAIALRGVEILELMRVTMDETFVGDAIAVRRIAGYLETIAGVIDDLKVLLLDVQRLCNPEVYYNVVRPWFRGEDSYEFREKRKWTFEGLEDAADVVAPTELSGPSAGQSSMVHVLDIFLGVDHQATTPGKPSFMSRMQSYMPHNHRMFLDHLKANPRPLRNFVVDAKDDKLLAAYTSAVKALKEFRDAHMIIVTLYVTGPARRAAKIALEKSVAGGVEHVNAAASAPLKGTGGTDLVKFLKDTRTRTTEALIS